nr:MAG TPA: hypothetical protein [Caudoviricetes sp.]
MKRIDYAIFQLREDMEDNIAKEAMIRTEQIQQPAEED